MSTLSSQCPGIIHLERLKNYTEDPTPAKGINFILPFVLEAFQNLNKAEAKEALQPQRFLINEKLDDVWVSAFQKIGETLPNDVVNELVNLLNSFIQSEGDVQTQLAIAFFEKCQECGIDKHLIFDELLTKEQDLFNKEMLDWAKYLEIQTRVDLQQKQLEWVTAYSNQRNQRIWKHYGSKEDHTSLYERTKAVKKQEKFETKLKYFDLQQPIDQTLFINDFLLSFYNKFDSFWQADIKALTESSESCHERKASLLIKRKQELQNIHKKYKQWLKELKKAQKNSSEESEINKNVISLENICVNLPARQTDLGEYNDMHQLFINADENKRNKSECVIL